ncbi:MAG: N-6 DNA methylase, partial [Staphylococcus equorum]|nr:N-6 DNA methylase [Staphylococcus equorum]
MEQLKQKLSNLGYKDIKELDGTSFLAGGNDIYVYAKKIEDGAELSPDLVTEINYEAMELNPFPVYAWITNGVSNVYLNVEDMKSISEIPQSVNIDKMIIKKREYTE